MGSKRMKAVIKVCVLLLVAMFLLSVPSFSDSRKFSTPQPEVELQEEAPGVTPKGDSETPKADVKPEKTQQRLAPLKLN